MAARGVLYLCLPRRPSASAIIKLRALANCRLMGHSRRFDGVQMTSGLPSRADRFRGRWHVSKVLKTLLASRRLAPISHAQSSNGSFIRQARINPKFGGMLLSPSPITFRFRNVAECANALIPVAISRETIHTICVGEGIFVQRFDDVYRARDHNILRLARAHW
jgi:hypothetical protein